MSRFPRICGCNRIVPAGARCICQIAKDRARKARFDRTRPNSSARGYDRQWEQAARAYLKQPGNERCACGAPATLVRHRVSIRQCPERRMDPTNWQPGCAHCNAVDAARERDREEFAAEAKAVRERALARAERRRIEERERIAPWLQEAIAGHPEPDTAAVDRYVQLARQDIGTDPGDEQ